MTTKPLVWLHGSITSPPFSREARRYAGYLLRELQEGEILLMPDSKPMPTIGNRVHELRINDVEKKLLWRIIYRIDHDAIILGDIFIKKSQKTPLSIIKTCKNRFHSYDSTFKRNSL